TVMSAIGFSCMSVMSALPRRSRVRRTRKSGRRGGFASALVSGEGLFLDIRRLLFIIAKPESTGHGFATTVRIVRQLAAHAELESARDARGEHHEPIPNDHRRDRNVVCHGRARAASCPIRRARAQDAERRRTPEGPQRET